MANRRPWAYTQNQFLIATKGSYRLAVRISAHHYSALISKAGEPFFDGLTATFAPLHLALKDSYSTWMAENGSRQGRTLQVKQLIRLLGSNKIKKWEVGIQAFYPDNTPEYKSMLPDGKGPFQQGSQEDRLAAITALVSSTGHYPALAAVTADASIFSATIQLALSQQKGSKTNTQMHSNEVEAARVAMCIGMYGNLALLMHHYAASTHSIAMFFDLPVIRSGAQTVFTGDTKPMQVENIFRHTFRPGEKLLLKNEGITGLMFFLSQQKKDTGPDVPISVGAGQRQTIAATDLGDVSHTYFKVMNNDAINTGEWTVEFI